MNQPNGNGTQTVGANIQAAAQNGVVLVQTSQGFVSITLPLPPALARSLVKQLQEQIEAAERQIIVPGAQASAGIAMKG